MYIFLIYSQDRCHHFQERILEKAWKNIRQDMYEPWAREYTFQEYYSWAVTRDMVTGRCGELSTPKLS